jgi:hypothetical protein
MAAIWYFFPDKMQTVVNTDGRLNRSTLRAVGLDRVLEDVRTNPDDCLHSECVGPGGERGHLLYPIPISGDLPKKVGYDSVRQSWRPAGSGRYWLGYEPDSPPQPADLERKVQVGGIPIKDAHEQVWLVPLLRAVDNPRGRLSVAFSWDAQDNPQIGVDPRYADLWLQSARVWDLIDHHTSTHGAVFSQAFDAETDAFLLGYTLDCLAINYRVNGAVFRLLDGARPGWLDQSTASWMLNATVDLFKYRAFLEAQKKTAS